MKHNRYLMESDEEALRLDIKTDENVVLDQAHWAGLSSGMRVADLGCGSGKAAFFLNQIVQPGGTTVGVDFSEQRISYAKDNYRHDTLSFVCTDIRQPLDNLGKFDFIWMRFVLEYYRSESFDIVKNIARSLKPGGILCLIDLDYNLKIFYGQSKKLKKTILDFMDMIETEANFDPHVGQKLYSFLYDLGYVDIDAKVQPHNLIFGDPKEKDIYNLTRKLLIAREMSDFPCEAYGGDVDAFMAELTEFMKHPRRFTYTPLIICRGKKPL